MEDSATLYNRMNEINQQLANIGTASQGDIADILKQRVGYFRPELEELRGVEGAAFQTPASDLSQFYAQGMTGGGGERGASAMALLNSALQRQQQQLGTADVLGNVLNQRMGTIDSMANRILQGQEAERGRLADQRAYLQSLYQTALQREEADAARRASAAAMAGLGGFGGFGGQVEQPQQTSYVDLDAQTAAVRPLVRKGLEAARALPAGAKALSTVAGVFGNLATQRGREALLKKYLSR